MNPAWLQRAASIAFTALAGLFLGVIIFLGRESFLASTLILSKNAYLPRALDKVYLVVFGLIWLLGWFVFEAYFSGGIARGNMLARFLQVLGWELVALFAFSILAYLNTSDGVNWTAVSLLAAALVAGVALLRVARRMFVIAQEK
jgi:hypothetical protein